MSWVSSSGLRLLVIALGLSLGIAGAHSQASSWSRFPNAPQAPEAVASHFIGFVQGYAASRGYRISDISQRELFDAFAARASFLGANRDAQLDAEANLMRFVDAMIEISRDSPGQIGDPRSLTVLGEASFLPALRSLCPLWPICS